MHDAPKHEAKSVPFAVPVLAVCLRYHYRVCADMLCCLPCRVQLTLYLGQLDIILVYLTVKATSRTGCEKPVC
jgi:hypothetical protein